MLRERQWNAEKSVNQTNLKNGALKHKTSQDDIKDGPPRPKRAALGDITEALSSTLIDSSKKQNLQLSPKPAKLEQRLSPLAEQELASTLEVDPLPGFDFDKENHSDPYSVSEFACDIFRYYKHREGKFQCGDYIKRNQSAADKVKLVDNQYRAKMVDLLIEIQESFELNHETLYLAVKLMDLYFDKVDKMEKSIAPLAACTAAFIAAKMEERMVPTIDDLLYMINIEGSRVRFTSNQMKKMERELLRTVGYDLGAPSSYSFLRRYARVIKLNMQVLTTARYYLEASLHILDFCRVSDSRLAMAALLLALKVTKTTSPNWDLILEKYSGYKKGDKKIADLMMRLNHMVHRFPIVYPGARTVIEKYSHTLFFEVAKQPLLHDQYARSLRKASIEFPAELLFESSQKMK